MGTATIKHMASSFAKLEKFKGVDFRRWQKKMHFMLSSMSVMYVLTTPMPDDGGENPTVKQVRKRAKWDNNDYDTLEAKYMAEDASSKKFLVSNFTNYKMTDSRPVLGQYNELLGILGRFTQHNMNMDESIQISCIIDKLPPSWKDFKHTLKHLKEKLTLIELGSHLRIEESLRAQDNDKPKGNNVAGPSVFNMVEHNNSSRHLKKDCKDDNVGNRANGSSTKGSKDGSSNPLKGQSMFNKSYQIYYVTYVSEAFFVRDDDVSWWVDSGATVHDFNLLYDQNTSVEEEEIEDLCNGGNKEQFTWSHDLERTIDRESLGLKLMKKEVDFVLHWVWILPTRTDFLTHEVVFQPRLLPMLKGSSKKWKNILRNGTMEHLKEEVQRLLMD
ncbi:hypothetical protein Tco_1394069 [Tanacetum coccineum]